MCGRNSGNSKVAKDGINALLKSKKRSMYHSDLQISFNCLDKQASSSSAGQHSQGYQDEDTAYSDFNPNNFKASIKGVSSPHLNELSHYNLSLSDDDTIINESDDDLVDRLKNRLKLNISLKTALKRKDYKSALLHVKNDAEFPENFEFKDVDVRDQNAVKFMDYLIKISALHFFIKYAPHRITKLKIDSKSKYYLNLKNESALYTSVITRKFKAYAFLKSISAEFKNSEEGGKAKENLNREELRNLDDINFSHLQRVEKPYLRNLIIKSGGSNCSNFEKTVTDYYTELDQIPEISTIFKVLQHTDNLMVAFNFNDRDVCDIVASSPRCMYGLTDGIKGRVCIGANRKREKVLGVLAHELTHMAMHVVYENDSRPYESDIFDDEEKQNFNLIVSRVRDVLNPEKDNTPEKTLFDAFHDDTYKNLDPHPEVIARVPHILAQFENGREWLETNAGELFEYFKKVLLDCEEFIKTGPISRKIKHLNESQGEINKIKEIGCALRFKNISENLSDCLRVENNFIFIVKTENVICTALRTLGVFYGKKYTRFYKEYFIFKLERLLLNYEKIFLLTQIPGVVKMIVIQVISYNDSYMNKALGILLRLQQERPSLKFIFIMKEGGEELAKKFSNGGLTQFLELSDDQFRLGDLDDESGKEIMGCEVVYQGKVMKVYELVEKNADLLSLIGMDEMVKLLDHENGEVLNLDGILMKLGGLKAALREGVGSEKPVKGSKNNLVQKNKSKGRK